jgi:hypothetical protein
MIHVVSVMINQVRSVITVKLPTNVIAAGVIVKKINTAAKRL